MKRLLLCLVVTSFAATPVFAERILLPVYTAPVHGAFGSEFRTDLRIFNMGERTVELAGLLPYCAVCASLPPQLSVPLEPGEEFEPGELAPNGTPGRFIRIEDSQVEDLAFNLRVYDTTRDAMNFGTELPVVRESDFPINRVVLLGVPNEARFRNTLRIYATQPVHVMVKVGNATPVRLELTATDTTFEPKYAIYANFPVTSPIPVRVEVVADPDFVSLLPIEIPLWAFITVTNNETQAITTITPQQ